MSSPIVPSKILSPLTDISKANISLLPETFYNLEEEDLLKLPNILQSNNTINQLGSSYQFRTLSKVIKYVDYKNFKRPGKAMLVFQSHNIFYAKRIS